MSEIAEAALAKAGKAFKEAQKDTKPFIPRDFSRFFMLHGTLTDVPFVTTASATYTSLIRPFTASKQIKFTLNSNNNGVFTVFYSLDGVTYQSAVVTGVQDPVSTKWVYERIVAGPIVRAYYRYVETAAVGGIIGGILSLESVVG